MKFEINEKDLKFVPFTITLRVERRDELMELWHKLLFELELIKEADYGDGGLYYPEEESKDICELWNELNKIAIISDLKYK